jgi:hypothetical protein
VLRSCRDGEKPAGVAVKAEEEFEQPFACRRDGNPEIGSRSLPIAGTVDGLTDSVRQCRWELSAGKKLKGQGLVAVGRRANLHGGSASGIPRRHIHDDLLRRLESLLDASNRRHQIRVAADQNEAIREILVRIVEHAHRDIDVGALLFDCREHPVSDMGAGPDPAADFLPLELSENDLDEGVGGEGLEVRRLVRTRSVYRSREVANDLDVVVWAQKCEIAPEVQPLVRATLQGPVVEVEAVDVDD